MKKKRIIIPVIILLAIAILTALAIWFFTVGGAIDQNEFERDLVGKWAYLHDTETEVASFRRNGKAKYEGSKYTYSSDGTYIRFSGGSGDPLELRYARDTAKDRVIIYIKSRYARTIGDTANGIVGVWVDPETNWSYEFTNKGTFMEDGILTGYYSVDEENGTIRLAYEMYLEDTIFYYRLDGDDLYVEYPWPMVRMK